MNKEERIQYVLDNIKDNVAVNIALSLVEECDELKQENKQLKEKLEKKNKIIKEINNMNIETIEESKKIETLPILKDDELFKTHLAINQTRRKLNEIIDYLMENK